MEQIIYYIIYISRNQHKYFLKILLQLFTTFCNQKMNRWKDYLQKIYYDPSHPGSYED